jgi:hypothetical protein
MTLCVQARAQRSAGPRLLRRELLKPVATETEMPVPGAWPGPAW